MMYVQSLQQADVLQLPVLLIATALIAVAIVLLRLRRFIRQLEVRASGKISTAAQHLQTFEATLDRVRVYAQRFPEGEAEPLGDPSQQLHGLLRQATSDYELQRAALERIWPPDTKESPHVRLWRAFRPGPHQRQLALAEQLHNDSTALSHRADELWQTVNDLAQLPARVALRQQSATNRYNANMRMGKSLQLSRVRIDASYEVLEQLRGAKRELQSLPGSYSFSDDEQEQAASRARITSAWQSLQRLDQFLARCEATLCSWQETCHELASQLSAAASTLSDILRSFGELSIAQPYPIYWSHSPNLLTELHISLSKLRDEATERPAARLADDLTEARALGEEARLLAEHIAQMGELRQTVIAFLRNQGELLHISPALAQQAQELATQAARFPLQHWTAEHTFVGLVEEAEHLLQCKTDLVPETLTTLLDEQSLPERALELPGFAVRYAAFQARLRDVQATLAELETQVEHDQFELEQLIEKNSSMLAQLRTEIQALSGPAQHPLGCERLWDELRGHISAHEAVGSWTLERSPERLKHDLGVERGLCTQVEASLAQVQKLRQMRDTYSALVATRSQDALAEPRWKQRAYDLAERASRFEHDQQMGEFGVEILRADADELAARQLLLRPLWQQEQLEEAELPGQLDQLQRFIYERDQFQQRVEQIVDLLGQLRAQEQLDREELDQLHKQVEALFYVVSQRIYELINADELAILPGASAQQSLAVQEQLSAPPKELSGLTPEQVGVRLKLNRQLLAEVQALSLTIHNTVAVRDEILQRLHSFRGNDADFPQLQTVERVYKQARPFAEANWPVDFSISQLCHDYQQLESERRATVEKYLYNSCDEAQLPIITGVIGQLMIRSTQFSQRLTRVEQDLVQLVNQEQQGLKRVDDQLHFLEQTGLLYCEIPLDVNVVARQKALQQLYEQGKAHRQELKRQGSGTVLMKVATIAKWCGASNAAISKFKGEINNYMNTTLSRLRQQTAQHQQTTKLKSLGNLSRTTDHFAREVTKLQSSANSRMIGQNVFELTHLSLKIQRHTEFFGNLLAFSNRIEQCCADASEMIAKFERLLKERGKPTTTRNIDRSKELKSSTKQMKNLFYNSSEPERALQLAPDIIRSYQQVVSDVARIIEEVERQRQEIVDLENRIRHWVAQIEQYRNHNSTNEDLIAAVNERLSKIQAGLRGVRSLSGYKQLLAEEVKLRLTEVWHIAYADIHVTKQGLIIQTISVQTIQAGGSVTVTQEASARP